MKITLSRAEVEKILLDYANKVVEGQGFNEVNFCTYTELLFVEVDRTESKEVQE
jgi:hypothetical protein